MDGRRRGEDGRGEEGQTPFTIPTSSSSWRLPSFEMELVVRSRHAPFHSPSSPTEYSFPPSTGPRIARSVGPTGQTIVGVEQIGAPGEA